MPVLAQAFLSPRSVQKSISTRLRQRKGCLYHSGDAVFLGFTHCKTHHPYLSHLIPFHRRSFFDSLSNTSTFKTTYLKPCSSGFQTASFKQNATEPPLL